ncbi:MAG: tetratricopeptide repeat protein, partial [Myxococcota bacterium]
GKTRLAVQAAREHPGPWPGGVRFCDLSDARSEADVVRALARLLRVVLDDEPVALLAFVLSGGERQLLVMDNVEQVADEVRGLVARWTEAADQLHVLVTSRRALGLPGEHQVVLPPLDPSDAEALYMQAASGVDASVVLSDDDRAVLPELLRLLDRLPLAIELAAARVRLLPPTRLLPRLGNRFVVLSRRRASHRHDSLAATLQWSWALLGPDEQLALARLSVFEGGFSLEAAEAVLDDPNALDLLQELVDRSWVSRMGDDWYGLLVSVQAYVAQQEIVRDAAEQLHGAYFAKLGRRLLDGEPPGRLRDQILADFDNVIVALRRALDRRDPEVAFETLVAAWSGFSRIGPYASWIALAEEVFRAFELSHRRCAEVRALWAEALALVGRPRASREVLGPSVRAVSEGAVGGLTAVRVRAQHGLLLHRAGRLDESAEELGEALRAVQRLGVPFWEAALLRSIGLLDAERSRFAEARLAYEAALAIALDTDDPGAEARARCRLGALAIHQRRYGDSRADLESALMTARALGDRQLEAEALRQLGGLHKHLSPPAVAVDHLESALALANALGNRPMVASIRTSLGWACLELGELSRAREHVAAVLASLHVLRTAGIAARAHLAAADLAAASHDYDAADRHYRCSVDTCRDAGLRSLEAVVLTRWARAQIAEGRDAARATVAAAEALVDETSEPAFVRVVGELRRIVDRG